MNGDYVLRIVTVLFFAASGKQRPRLATQISQGGAPVFIEQSRASTRNKTRNLNEKKLLAARETEMYTEVSAWIAVGLG